MKKENFTVIALGGSIIVPHLSDDGGINVSFLRDFRSFLLKEIKAGRRFIIVVGGGRTARVYNKAASAVGKMAPEDLDWIGIHAIRLNAHLLRTIFVKEAYPVVIDHDPSFQEAASLKRKKKNLFIASGWRPGWSTDYVAIRTAQKFHAAEVIIAGDTPYVYEKDPKKFPSATPFRELSWKDYRMLIPDKWTPGLSSPVDPIGAKLAQKIKLPAKIIQGSDLKNFKNAIEGKPFEGTTIQ